MFRHGRPSRVFATMAAMLLLALVGTGIASAQALPGDRLYPLKRAAEQTRLNLAQNPAQRLQIEQAYDRERQDEVEALIAHQREVEVDFAGILGVDDLTGKVTVGLVELALPSASWAEFPPGSYVDVHGIPMPDGKVVVEQISLHTEEIRGQLEQVDASVWVVSGLVIHVSPQTEIRVTPARGAAVLASVTRQTDGSLKAISLLVGDQEKEHAPITVTTQPAPTTVEMNNEEESKTPEPAEEHLTSTLEHETEDSSATPEPEHEENHATETHEVEAQGEGE